MQVLQLCRKHEVTIDSSYASLVVAVCVLVGFARSLDPELSIMDAAIPCLFFYNLVGQIPGGIYGWYRTWSLSLSNFWCIGFSQCATLWCCKEQSGKIFLNRLFCGFQNLRAEREVCGTCTSVTAIRLKAFEFWYREVTMSLHCIWAWSLLFYYFSSTWDNRGHVSSLPISPVIPFPQLPSKFLFCRILFLFTMVRSFENQQFMKKSNQQNKILSLKKLFPFLFSFIKSFSHFCSLLKKSILLPTKSFPYPIFFMGFTASNFFHAFSCFSSVVL